MVGERSGTAVAGIESARRAVSDTRGSYPLNTSTAIRLISLQGGHEAKNAHRQETVLFSGRL